MRALDIDEVTAVLELGPSRRQALAKVLEVDPEDLRTALVALAKDGRVERRGELWALRAGGQVPRPAKKKTQTVTKPVRTGDPSEAVQTDGSRAGWWIKHADPATPRASFFEEAAAQERKQTGTDRLLERRQQQHGLMGWNRHV